MARGAVAITRQWPSALTAALVLFVTLGATIAVALKAEIERGLSSADWAAIRFTITQAMASAVISTALAIPTARAIARRQFRGRSALITLLGAPFLLPVIVAIIGLLAVFGRSGILNRTLDMFGLPPVSIYGFHGVVLAHVFFNLPLATRMILQAWLSVPAERYRLAATLNLDVRKIIERPMLRQVVPGILLIVFLICLTSFAVALTLGGGPKATTIELAIYQALRFDFDLGRAALLSCLQLLICVIAALIAWRVATPDQFGKGLDRVVQRWDTPSKLDPFWLGAVSLFLLVPLAMVLIRGVGGLADMPSEVWAAALRSITVAICAAALSLGMALALTLHASGVFLGIGMLPMAASSLVVGTGLFIITFQFVAPSAIALPLTMLVNALFALPFVIRIIHPAIAQVQSNFDPLAHSMGLRGLSYLRLLIIPRTRRALGFAGGIAAALSMGDLGVIALFANEATTTLPLVMYRLMGAYRMDAAAGAGVLLLGLSFALFWLCDKWGRGFADT